MCGILCQAGGRVKRTCEGSANRSWGVIFYQTITENNLEFLAHTMLGKS